MNDQTILNEGMIVPVWNTMILPNVDAQIHIKEMNEKLKDYLDNQHNTLIAVPNKNQSELHSIGVLFEVVSIERTEDDYIIKMHTKDRVRILNQYQDQSVLKGTYQYYPDHVDLDEKMHEEMLGYLKQIVKDINGKFSVGNHFNSTLDSIHDINTMIMYLSQYLPLSSDEKYQFLKLDSLRERSLRFMDTLIKQKEVVDWNLQINERMSDKANKLYREQMLREQLKSIQDELNESNEEGDSNDYISRINASNMPEDIKKEALKQVDKLNAQPQGGPEVSVIQNYLDFMLSMPWGKEEEVDFDLNEARQILDDDHYGLEKVKERIIQQLAVMKLKKDKHGSILLLVGPPGTGKTSLGKSIAKALKRKYVRMSLGGVRDEAEIRGHRRTYVGAMPGRVLESIKQAGTTNPVMVLDEIDKLMAGGFSGDPSSALLEVLDPEQNDSFTDHYLDLPYDLSDVFFIATANSLDTIPGPLLDRMEIIQINGYTNKEKFHIAKDHLLPEVIEDHGLLESQFKISDDVLEQIIEEYSVEAGVRGLKKQLSTLARVATEKIVSKKTDCFIVESTDLQDYLGHKMSHHEKASASNPPGVVTGMAWTPVGGEILFIESLAIPGSGQIHITGQLGDVMQESAMISHSLVKSRLPLGSINFKEKDIHIHVPSGSIPKDGPSAGITLFTALASLYTGIPVDSHIAMTGEVTLRGQVMPIGGLKEKLLGAHRAGIKKVLIPRENEQDLKDVDDEIKRDIKIIAVDTVDDVLKETLGIELPSHSQSMTDPSVFINHQNA